MSVDDTTRAPSGRDTFRDEWVTYLDLRDRRAGDLDNADTDARELGYAGRDEQEQQQRTAALRTLAAVILATDPDGRDFGTDPATEADLSDLTDADIGDTADELTDERLDELVTAGRVAYLTVDHEAGHHDPHRRTVDDTNMRPNPDCALCPERTEPTGPGFLPADPFERWHQAAIFAALRSFATLDRRARVATAERDGAPLWPYGPLAPAAAPLSPTDLRDEQRELVTVWGGWVHEADTYRAMLASACEPCRTGRHVACTALAGDCTTVCHPVPSGYRGNVYRGSWYADVDASAERYELSPSGRWSVPRLFPAGYLAGWRGGMDRRDVQYGRDPRTIGGRS